MKKAKESSIVGQVIETVEGFKEVFTKSFTSRYPFVMHNSSGIYQETTPI